MIDALRRHTLLRVQLAIKPSKALLAEMALLEEFFLAQEKPLAFNPYDPVNVVMDGERTFEQVCLTMMEAGMREPKKMSEYEFYNALLFFQKKYENLK